MQRRVALFLLRESRHIILCNARPALPLRCSCLRSQVVLPILPLPHKTGPQWTLMQCHSPCQKLLQTADCEVPRNFRKPLRMRQMHEQLSCQSDHMSCA